MLIVEYLANVGKMLKCSPSFLTFFGNSFIEIHSHTIKSTCEVYISVAFSMFTEWCIHHYNNVRRFSLS